MESSRKPDKSSFLFDLFGFPMLPIQGALRVKKRDSHIEPFSLQKLSTSIKNALRSAGVDERGLDYSLACAVKTYLRECHGLESIIPSQEISTVTIQVLQEMGENKTARVYKEFARQKSLQQRLITTSKITTFSVKKSNEDSSLEYIEFFKQNTDVITEQIHNLLEILNLKKEILEKVVKQVLEVLGQIDCQRPSLNFLGELCATLLRKEGISISNKQSLVSLYTNECFEIIKNVHIEELTPEDTDNILGRKIKEQVSRSFIFSPEVLDAHDKGFIYIHTLDKLDRLWSFDHSAYALWSLGREKISSIRTPGDFWNLLTDTYYERTDFFVKPITWWGFNWAIAPLLKGLEGNDYRDWLFQWVDECEEMSSDEPGMQIVFDWAVPEKWADSYALGNRGKNLRTPYSAYSYTAQEMMTDVMECISKRGKSAPSLSRFFLWRFNLPLQVAPSHSFWHLLTFCVEDNEMPISLYFTPLDFISMNPQIGLGGMTINLARIAYNQPSERPFYTLVFQTLLLAIRACEEGLKFISTYYGDMNGGIWKSVMEQIYKNPSNIPCITAFPINLYLCGLREALQIMSFDKELKNIEVWDKAEVMLKKIKGMLAGCLKEKNLKVNLCLETNINVLRKLAQKDMDELSDLFVMLERDESFRFLPQYSSDIAPLVFYHPDELVPQLKKLFNIAQLLDEPVPAYFSPQRVWDGLILGEVIELFNKTNTNNVPVLLRFIPSE